MDAETVIAAVNLSKVFTDFWRRARVPAVQEISFEVRRGEVFGLLGPNGSGKSTTIKMLLGLLHPTRGVLRVLGASARDVAAKARIGYLPEESHLYPYLTAEETLEYYGKLFDLDAAERKRRIGQLFDMIGLQHARRRAVGEFSKGMARRLGLAQALINDPDLVILDEPTSGLDPIGCRQIKDLILTLARRGKTVLLSSHLLADVEDVCHRVAILYGGRIRAMGSLDELLTEPSRVRITLPPDLPAAAMQQVLAATRAALAAEPAIDHPRRNLEQFFIEVVEQARRGAAESAGVAAGKGLAGYLASEGGAAPAALLARLARPDASPAPAAPAPAAPPPAEAPPRDLKKADEALRGLVPPKP